MLAGRSEVGSVTPRLAREGHNQRVLTFKVLGTMLSRPVIGSGGELAGESGRVL